MINQKKLFFVIVGRSGTSLMQELLATCKKKRSFVEKLNIHKKHMGNGCFCHAKESTVKNPKWRSFWTPVRQKNDFSELEEFISKNWTEEYFIEKTPDSITCLHQMVKRYPKANYVFIKRNPEDIVKSQLNLFPENEDMEQRDFHISSLVMSPEDRILEHEHYWAKYTNKMIRQMINYEGSFRKKISIKYEELINNPEKEIWRIRKKFNLTTSKETFSVLRRQSYSQKPKTMKFDIQNKEALKLIEEAKIVFGYQQ